MLPPQVPKFLGPIFSLSVSSPCMIETTFSLFFYPSRNQILMSKRLITEGADTWSMISKNNERALWSSAIPVIIKKFMDIGHSVNRGLSEQVELYFFLYMTSDPLYINPLRLYLCN